MIARFLVFMGMMLSDSGEVSFGRCAAGFWGTFLMGMEIWYTVHNGKLVDNSTLMCHVAVVATLYGLGKLPSSIGAK